MADTVVGLRLQTQGGDQVQNTVGNIKKELRSAQQEAVALSAKFGETSQEALDAAKRVAQLRDQIQDTNERVALFDPGARFAAFGNVLRTVAGGFSALTGSLALFGVQSEEVEKTLLKVQAALAITEGVNTIVDAGKDFQRLQAIISQTTIVQKAFAASTLLTSNAFKALGISVTTTSTAFRVLRTAIIATGVGALVVGVGLLIEKMSSLTNATDDQTRAQDRLREATDRLNESLQEQIGFSDRAAQESIAAAKARGASERELTNIERKAIQDRIFLRETALQDAKAKGLDTLKFEQELSNEQQKLRIFDLNEQANALQKQKQLNSQATAEANKRAADAKAAREAAEAERKAREGRIADPLGPRTAEELEEQAKLRREAEARELTALEAFEQGKIDIVARGLATVATLEAKQADDNAKAKEQAVELERQAQQQRVAIITGALGALSDAVGRETAAGKALSIAQAVIDTYTGANKALAAAPPPFNFIQAGAVIAAGFANVRRIISTKVPGQAGGGSIPGGALVSAPTIQRQTANTTTLDQRSINAIGDATARVFVLESDVTTGQERRKRLNRAARLG